MILETGLETHPAGTTNPNAIINANWLRLNTILIPYYDRNLYKSTSAITVSGTTETTLFDLQDISLNSCVSVRGFGFIPSGNFNATFKIYVNGHTITSTGDVPVLTNQPFDLFANIHMNSLGATGKALIFGRTLISTQQVGGAYCRRIGDNTVYTIDTTQPLNFKMTYKLNTAGKSVSFDMITCERS